MTLVSECHMLHQVKNAARVAVLIVVPADDLAEVVVEGHAGLGVEHHRVGLADEVSGHDGVFGVSEDAL